MIRLCLWFCGSFKVFNTKIPLQIASYVVFWYLIGRSILNRTDAWFLPTILNASSDDVYNYCKTSSCAEQTPQHRKVRPRFFSCYLFRVANSIHKCVACQLTSSTVFVEITRNAFRRTIPSDGLVGLIISLNRVTSLGAVVDHPEVNADWTAQAIARTVTS